MPEGLTVGVSLKMYFGHRRALDWFDDVAERVRTHPALADGSVRLFVCPGYLQIAAALEAFRETPVLVGAQDVATDAFGAFTGEVSASELAEIGVSFAEIGHAERRRRHGETDATVAAKARAAVSHGLTPVLCLGETDRTGETEAAGVTVAQLEAGLDGVPDGPVVVAYEPVWAIGAPSPASPDHIVVVCGALRKSLGGMPGRSGSAVIYGGSAGPGLMTKLGGATDGLFLGRFAHDPANLVAVLDEAAELACGTDRTTGRYRSDVNDP
jgi:triosephosphate isomerase